MTAAETLRAAAAKLRGSRPAKPASLVGEFPDVNGAYAQLFESCATETEIVDRLNAKHPDDRLHYSRTTEDAISAAFHLLPMDDRCAGCQHKRGNHVGGVCGKPDCCNGWKEPK